MQKSQVGSIGSPSKPIARSYFVFVKKQGSSPKELKSFTNINNCAGHGSRTCYFFCRRLTQTFADNLSFLPGRPVFARGFAEAGLAQAKSACLSGKRNYNIAKRLMFLPPHACRVEARRAKPGRGGKRSASGQPRRSLGEDGSAHVE